MTAVPPLQSLPAGLPPSAPVAEVQGEEVAGAQPGFPDLFRSLLELFEDGMPAAGPGGRIEAKAKPGRERPEPDEIDSTTLAASLLVQVQPPPPELPAATGVLAWTLVEPVPAPVARHAELGAKEIAMDAAQAWQVTGWEPLAAPVEAAVDAAVNSAEERKTATSRELPAVDGITVSPATPEGPDSKPPAGMELPPREPQPAPELLNDAARPVTPPPEVPVEVTKPKTIGDGRFETKPRPRMEREIEPAEARARPSRPVQDWRPGPNRPAAMDTGGTQPIAHSEPSGRRSDGRGQGERSTDRRMPAAAGPHPGEAAGETAGETAFSARLVPIATGAAQAARESSRSDVTTPPGLPERPVSATSEPVPVPEPARSSPVHDIRLELNGGERKVEVHLVERAGEVRVAVRTPDVRLAGEIRENLPALSSRLEQTGYRAETWHGSPDGSRHSSQQEREHPQRQPQQPLPEELPKRKQKGQPFAWLMSALR